MREKRRAPIAAQCHYRQNQCKQRTRCDLKHRSNRHSIHSRNHAGAPSQRLLHDPHETRRLDCNRRGPSPQILTTSKQRRPPFPPGDQRRHGNQESQAGRQLPQRPCYIFAHPPRKPPEDRSRPPRPARRSRLPARLSDHHGQRADTPAQQRLSPRPAGKGGGHRRKQQAVQDNLSQRPTENAIQKDQRKADGATGRPQAKFRPARHARQTSHARSPAITTHDDLRSDGLGDAEGLLVDSIITLTVDGPVPLRNHVLATACRQQIAKCGIIQKTTDLPD